MKRISLFICMASILLIISCGKQAKITNEKYVLLAPASPASIPLIRACSNLENIDVKLFTNHTKAHASFLRGDAEFIATGYNVGVNFRKSSNKIRIASSLVNELSYFVSTDPDIDSLFKINVKEVNLPFKGSPIELLFDSVAKAENINSISDCDKRYIAFPSTMELFKKGKAFNAVLPEPFVSMLIKQGIIKSYISLQKRFQEIYQADAPQLALFTKDNIDCNMLVDLLSEIDASVKQITVNPDETIKMIGDALPFPEEIIKNSVSRIGYQNLKGTKLTENLIKYHKIMGDDFAPQESFVIITEK